MDLATVISKGTMKAVAEIAAAKGISKNVAANVDQVLAAVKVAILDGFDQAAADAKEALEAVGEAWARQSLNLSCNEFAIKALKATGQIQ